MAQDPKSLRRVGLTDAPRVRVAIVADTHGFLDARVAEAVEAHDCVVHAGDVGAAGVLESLHPRRGLVVAVRGNNDVRDKWPADDYPALRALPETVRIELPGGALAVIHGHRSGRPADRHRRLRAGFPDARAVVYGHSHRRCIDKRALLWVLNPGAAGRARAYGGPGLLSLTATTRRWLVRSVIFEPR